MCLPGSNRWFTRSRHWSFEYSRAFRDATSCFVSGLDKVIATAMVAIGCNAPRLFETFFT